MNQDGGHLVVDSLIAEGVDTVFTVPGESFLPVLNALIDPARPVQVISCRHESGAGFAAEAWAKATGRPGVLMVTRGPGLTNASIALHTAMQDSTPLVAFVGQVPVDQLHREAFQEVDVVSYLSPIVKWAIEVPQTARLPELIRQAFRVARSGRPGPVVVSLPEDILFAEAEARVLPSVMSYEPEVPAEAVEKAAELLRDARAPVIVAGREVNSPAGHQAVQALAHAWGLPVMTAFRRFDAYPNDDRNYAGPVALGAPAQALGTISDADVVLVLGDRLDEITTGGYEFLQDATVIHVSSSWDSTGSWGENIWAMTGNVTAFARKLAQKAPATVNNARTEGCNDGYRKLSEPEQPYREGGVNLSAALESIRRQAPADTAITTDAGNFAGFVARFYRFTRPRSHFGPLSGAMGYGAPSAIGVAVADPGRQVVALAGDGGFAMTMTELATMKAHGLKIVMIVCVNNLHGTIRMHQEKHYPGRPIATDLTNPDFRALAESYGLPAWRVTSNAEFDSALEQALATDGPAVIELMEGKERLSVWRPRAED